MDHDSLKTKSSDLYAIHNVVKTTVLEENYTKMIELCKDKFTNKIFLDPVMASDGYIYEFNEIFHYLLENKTSPTTNQPINDNLIKVNTLKSLINILIDAFPTLKENQYVNKKWSGKTDIKYYKYIINYCISNNNYELLKNIEEMDFNIIDNIRDFITNCPLNIMKKLLENTVNINDNLNKGECLLYYIAIYGTMELNKFAINSKLFNLHFISKGHNNNYIGAFMTRNDMYGSSQIHIVKLLIDNQVSLLDKTKRGNYIIILLLNYSESEELCLYALKSIKKLDLATYMNLKEKLDKSFKKKCTEQLIDIKIENE